MSKKLEQLGLYNGIFHRQGVEVNVKVLSLGIINNFNKPMDGNYIPEMADAYVVGDRETPSSNKFPIIYLKIIE